MRGIYNTGLIYHELPVLKKYSNLRLNYIECCLDFSTEIHFYIQHLDIIILLVNLELTSLNWDFDSGIIYIAWKMVNTTKNYKVRPQCDGKLTKSGGIVRYC